MLACRNLPAAEAVATEIRGLQPGSQVVVGPQLDLASEVWKRASEPDASIAPRFFWQAGRAGQYPAQPPDAAGWPSRAHPICPPHLPTPSGHPHLPAPSGHMGPCCLSAPPAARTWHPTHPTLPAPPTHPPTPLTAHPRPLAPEQDSVRQFAAAYKAQGRPLHVLINNAGANHHGPPWFTPAGVGGQGGGLEGSRA